MRMRKKKHQAERLESCSNIIIEDITRYSSDIKSVFEGDMPLHMEIGCGKGAFILETAKTLMFWCLLQKRLKMPDLQM